MAVSVERVDRRKMVSLTGVSSVIVPINQYFKVTRAARDGYVSVGKDEYCIHLEGEVLGVSDFAPNSTLIINRVNSAGVVSEVDESLVTAVGVECHASFNLPFYSANERVNLINRERVRVCRAEDKFDNGVEDTLLHPSVGEHFGGVLWQ